MLFLVLPLGDVLLQPALMGGDSSVSLVINTFRCRTSKRSPDYSSSARTVYNLRHLLRKSKAVYKERWENFRDFRRILT